MRLATVLFMLIVLADAVLFGATCVRAVSVCSQRVASALQMVEG